MSVATEERRCEEISVHTEIGRKNRAEFLDFLRGFAIIYVMLYHLLYDLIFFGGINMPFFFTGWWEAVHQLFLIILFGVSGVCAGFSRNVLKRGATLFLMGEALTIATSIFMPDNIIVFGVLSCFGTIMLIYGVISPLLKRMPNILVFVLFTLLTVVFFEFPKNESIFLLFREVRLNLPENANYLYPIGITSPSFRSADYFPLVPYGFIFLAGTAFSDCVKNGQLPKFFYKAKLPVINFLGRYSLWVYIIHQPVFMVITYLLFN
ncbi:MAG: DUF1624 domain-containing protein [Oscillospiraceae bacterium]|nr:DUF1624 domain-containing protein [Oscillospiraceae bacterium]